MHAIPFTKVNDQKQITNFWNQLIKKGATNLTYHTPTFEAVSTNSATLSSSWSMNIGEGTIYMEKWEFIDGKWLLSYDEFKVLKQY